MSVDRLPFAGQTRYSSAELLALHPRRNFPEMLLAAEVEPYTLPTYNPRAKLELVADEATEVERQAAGEDSAVDVRVVLVKLSEVPTRFAPHWARVVGCSAVKNSSVGELYGGRAAEADGPSPDTSLETQVAAAVRHLHEQSGLDLGGLPLANWHRVASYQMRGGSAKVPKLIVHVLPEYWLLPADAEAAVSSRRLVCGETKRELYPLELSLYAIGKGKGSLGLGAFTADFLLDRMSLAACEVIAGAVKEAKARREAFAARKREREERLEAVKRRRHETWKKRDTEAKDAVAEMKARWQEEDVGKTDEELQESKEQRKNATTDLLAELKAKWEEEDKNDSDDVLPEETVKPVERDVEASAAFGFFDEGIRAAGAVPAGRIQAETLLKLIQLGTGTHGRAACAKFVKEASGITIATDQDVPYQVFIER